MSEWSKYVTFEIPNIETGSKNSKNCIENSESYFDIGADQHFFRGNNLREFNESDDGYISLRNIS